MVTWSENNGCRGHCSKRTNGDTIIAVNGNFCQNSGGARGAPAAPAVAGGQPVDTIRRDEVCFLIEDELSSALSWRGIRSEDKLALQVNAVLANQRELVSATRDIKNFVTDVHRWVLSSMQIECSHFQILRDLDLVASVP